MAFRQREYMKHTHKVRRLVAAMTESEAIGLKKKRLTVADIDNIATDSETGVDENGNPLYILVKNVIPYEHCKAAYNVAVKAANQPVAGGSRADAAGVQMELRKRKDGTTSNRYAVPLTPELEGAKSGSLGSHRCTSAATEDRQHELVPDISTMQHWNSLQNCCLVQEEALCARQVFWRSAGSISQYPTNSSV
jgi:hypothetical protein